LVDEKSREIDGKSPAEPEDQNRRCVILVVSSSISDWLGSVRHRCRFGCEESEHSRRLLERSSGAVKSDWLE
jgi:hypothetical protein